MKVSVIIPVFNVEKYLIQCIDSVLNQSYSDLDIILVNDGSTDRSMNICNTFAEKDNRITVIHQDNAGVSVARNVGINAATGDYITFVDSDDWLDVDMYRHFIEKATKNQFPDVLMCDFINSRENQKTPISSHLPSGFYNEKQIIKKIYPTLLATEDFGRLPIVSACTCVFKSSFLLNNAIYFDQELRYSEDYLFMANVVTSSQSFYYLKDQYLYNYRQYDESRSKKYQNEWWETLLQLNRKLKVLIINRDNYDFARQLKLQLIHSVLLLSSSIISNTDIPMSEKMRLHQKLFNEAEVQHAFKDLPFDKQQINLKFILLLIKYKQAKFYLLFRSTISFIVKLKNRFL